MVMIQEGTQNTGADKPLRITGEPFKVQVGISYLVVSVYQHCSLGSSLVSFFVQQAKEMVMELIRDQGFREQRNEYGSRMGGGDGDSLDVSCKSECLRNILYLYKWNTEFVFIVI